jgi:hypothetical protein
MKDIAFLHAFYVGNCKRNFTDCLKLLHSSLAVIGMTLERPNYQWLYFLKMENYKNKPPLLKREWGKR